MRIVYMGTPDFAVPALEVCASLGEVVWVVTQPDRPSGRGQHPTPPPVKVWAQAHGIPVVQPERLKGTLFHEELAALAPDVAVVAAYGRILPPAVLAAPKHGCVNLHGSLLPKYRGAAPIQWAVANGEAETGVCLMRMEEGLDTGPVIARRAIPIGPEATGGSMHDVLAQLAAELLRDELPPYLAGLRTPVVQNHAEATLAPILKKEDGRVDFSRPARVIEYRIRGFTPWPGAWATVGGARLKIHKARVGDRSGPPGDFLGATEDGLEIACGEGSLVLLEVQGEGGRRMAARAYLAGHPELRG